MASHVQIIGRHRSTMPEVNVNQDDVFQAYRSLLLSIAYRMLGSVMDAEDCVKEEYVRWHQTVESGESVQYAVVALDMVEGGIQEIDLIVNPDKLRHIPLGLR